MEKNHFRKIALLVLFAVAGCAALFLLEPICQDPCYHNFADTRSCNPITNCWNVLSNIPFLGIGAAGMIYVFTKGRSRISSALRLNYFIFFFGIFLTGWGSGYYHLHPTNTTLVWDRLPMTISFMSFFSIVIGEYITEKHSRNVLYFLFVIGISSVIYWHFSETIGCGDLRWYMAIQFLPMVLIPFILVLFQTKNYPTKYVWYMLLVYVLAKVAELFDQPIFNSLHVISGHTIKHFLAAIAPILFLQGIKQIKSPK